MATSTFYPVAGANTPVDGLVQNSGSTYSTVHDASAGNSVQQTDAIRNFVIHGIEVTTYTINRGFFGFDISSIGSDTINSATFSLASDGGAGADTDIDTIDIVSATPASTDTLITDDYDQLGTTVYSNMTLANWDTTDGNYNDFVIDSTGRTYISNWTSQIGFLGTRLHKDILNSAPTGNNAATCYMADETGTTKDPKLVIVHSASFIPRIIIF